MQVRRAGAGSPVPAMAISRLTATGSHAAPSRPILPIVVADPVSRFLEKALDSRAPDSVAPPVGMLRPGCPTKEKAGNRAKPFAPCSMDSRISHSSAELVSTSTRMSG